MNVLFVKYKGRAAPYVMDDLHRYFEIKNHKAVTFDGASLVDLPRDVSSERMTIEVCSIVDSVRPDVVIAYGANNYQPCYYVGSQPVPLFNRLGIPSVSVWYDSPTSKDVFDNYYRVYDPKLNYQVVWDRHYASDLRKLGLEKVHFMPIASNVLRFKRFPYDEADARRFGADVSFVGSRTLKREIILSKLLDAGFNLVLWGYEWEKAVDKRLTACFRGIADNDDELAKVYNYSKVNVNITVDQGIGSLNMRVFDCMASGGFLVSDYKSDFESLFDAENEVVTYQSPEELVGAVRYYLDHEDERLDKAKKARKRVLAEHSYSKRVDFIVDMLESSPDFRKPDWPERFPSAFDALSYFLKEAKDREFGT